MGTTGESAKSVAAFVERIPTRIDGFCELFEMIPALRSAGMAAECRARLAGTGAVLEALAPIVCSFYDVQVFGGHSSESLGALNFRKRFGVEPDSENLSLLRDQLERMFVAGVCTHHFLTNFPTRFDASLVDMADLEQRWLSETLIADSKLGSYDRAQDKLPSAIADFIWTKRLEVFLRAGLGFGFWKLGKASGYSRNMFWSGVLLGLMRDIATKADVKTI